MLKTEYGGDALENQIISAELMELGNRVRKYRNERYWSQEKLAEKVDVSLNTVSRIEGGQTRMSIEIFMRLVQVLWTYNYEKYKFLISNEIFHI